MHGSLSMVVDHSSDMVVVETKDTVRPGYLFGSCEVRGLLSLGKRQP
jgi:hypothetical protein